MSDKDKAVSRRDFFRDAGRWLGVGALAGVSGLLGSRAVRRGACPNGRLDLCTACPAKTDCDVSDIDGARR